MINDAVDGLDVSLPMWERGLKLSTDYIIKRIENVAPHVGAWVETSLM